MKIINTFAIIASLFLISCGGSGADGQKSETGGEVTNHSGPAELKSSVSEATAADVAAMTAPSTVKVAISGMTSEADATTITNGVLALVGVATCTVDSKNGVGYIGYDGAVIHYEKIFEEIGKMEARKFSTPDHSVRAGVDI